MPKNTLKCRENFSLKMNDTVMCDSRSGVEESTCFGCEGPVGIGASGPPQKLNKNKSVRNNKPQEYEETVQPKKIKEIPRKELKQMISFYKSKCNQLEKDLKKKDRTINQLERESNLMSNGCFICGTGGAPIF